MKAGPQKKIDRLFKQISVGGVSCPLVVVHILSSFVYHRQRMLYSIYLQELVYE